VRLLAATLAVTTLAAPQLHFPRDHFGHRAGIEWWYFTADVHGSDGHRYSVFFTLFKSAGFVVPVSQVVNLDTGRIGQHTERLLRGSGPPFASNSFALGYAARSNIWNARAGRLRFEVRPEKPYVLHGGGTGVIRQGSGLSRYYSASRMAFRGSLDRLRLTGTAWFDHQWGDFQTNRSALHWDWFSCRFRDRTELMLYRFRSGGESGTSVDAAGHGRLVSSFRAASGKDVLRAVGRRWPLDWTLHVPSLQLDERLHAVVSDQLVRGGLLPTFWEGAATATGTKRGVCFVEETS
jgi:predicted secreted hydrolase